MLPSSSTIQSKLLEHHKNNSSSCPKKPLFCCPSSPKQKLPFVRSPVEHLCHRAKSASSVSKPHPVKSKISRLWIPTLPREKSLDPIAKPNTRGIRPRNQIFVSFYASKSRLLTCHTRRHFIGQLSESSAAASWFGSLSLQSVSNQSLKCRFPIVG